MAMADVVQQLVQLGADGAVLPRRWFNELYGAASEDADDNAGGVLPPASRALMALVQRGSSTGFDGPALWSGLRASDSQGVQLAVAMLYSRMISGPPLDAVLSSALYLQLVQLPGSDAYEVPSSIVLDRVCSVLAHNLLPIDMDDADDADAELFSDAKPKTRKTRTVAGSDDDDDDVDMDASGLIDDDDGDADTAAAPAAIIDTNLDAAVLDLLRAVSGFLRSFSLRDLTEVTEHYVETLGGAWAALRDHMAAGRDYSAALSLMPDILGAFASRLHGNVPSLLSLVFKSLLPLLLMCRADGSVSSPAPTKAVIEQGNAARALVLTIAGHVSSLEDAAPAWDKFVVLLQHMATRVPDRQEYRSHCAKSIATILAALPDANQTKFAEWLKRLIQSSKIGARAFGVDISRAIVVENGAKKYTFDASGLFVFATQRVQDRAPVVRARALQCVAAVFEAEGDIELRRQIAANLLGDGTFPSLQRRVADEKSAVRRAALQVVESLLMFGLSEKAPTSSMSVLLRLLHERCCDQITGIRKQAITATTAALLKYPEEELLWKMWPQIVLACVADREPSVVDDCVTCTNTVLLLPLINGPPSLADAALLLIDRLDAPGTKHLQCVIAELAKRNIGLSSTLSNALITCIERTPLAAAPWTLLHEIALQKVELLPAQKVVAMWQSAKAAAPQDDAAARRTMPVIVRTVGHVAKRLSSDVLHELAGQLDLVVRGMNASMPLVAAAVFAIDRCIGGMKKGGQMHAWCDSIVGECEGVLKSVASGGEVESDRLAVCLFTVGEIYQMRPGDLLPHIVTGVQTIMSSSSPLFPPHVRSQAFLTLGKLALQNEELAKAHMAVLASELASSEDPVVRNNVMLILCDLCIRYTFLVEKYIPTISACLHDPSELVRRQTLTMLTRLLQEDYVKWKGSLFLRFVTTVVDESADIREFAEYCLVELLLNKNPSILYSNFVECLFFLNGLPPKRILDTFSGTSDRAMTDFCGQSALAVSRRRAVYRFMLAHMADEYKFQLTAKLCTETLAGYLDGQSDASEMLGGLVLADVLYVLSSEEIKIAALRPRGASGSNEAEEGENMTTVTSSQVADSEKAAAMAAKAKILSKLNRKNTIENIVPVIVELKHFLERTHSPLLRDLTMCLRAIVCDYRVEMEDLMVGDKQLAQEIEFDLRRLEAEQVQARAAERAEKARQEAARQSDDDHVTQVDHVAGTPVRVQARLPVEVAEFQSPRLRRVGEAANGETPLGADDSFASIRLSTTPGMSPNFTPNTTSLKNMSTPMTARRLPGSSSPSPFVLGSARRLGAAGTPRIRAWNISSPLAKSAQPVRVVRKRELGADSDEDDMDEENFKTAKLQRALA